MSGGRGEDERDRVLGNLLRAVGILEGSASFAELMPEVRVNVVYALEGAAGVEDVAGVEGRITRVGGRVRACGPPAFGASSHMARLILEAMRYEPGIRAGVNFRRDEELSRWVEGFCKAKGISFGFVDRAEEPEEAAAGEGLSMPWKVSYLVRRYGRVPRVFYESAGMGKEPLFVVLGDDAVSAARLAVEIADGWTGRTPWGPR